MMESVQQADVEALQEENSALRTQLLQAQRMTALGELVSTTTHEFNNVLMSIINYAKMGIRHKDEPTRDKALAKILESGERAARITNSVLGMARNRSTRLEPTSLQQIIEETMVLLDREMSKYRIQVEQQFQETPNVLSNGSQIQQVILNLLINARQAMQRGGILIIRLDNDTENGFVDLTIRDSGCGIPNEKLRHIFEPFFTTKSGPDESGKGGTGLGLAACKDIIEAHNGRIKVQSTVGKGTAFTIKLPVADSDRE